MTTTEALSIEPQGLARVAQELLDNSGFLLARLGFAAKARALEEFDRLGYAAYHYRAPAPPGEGHRETQATIPGAPGVGPSPPLRLVHQPQHRRPIARPPDPSARP